jgi:SAM-dependent methyltransferase
MLDSVDLGKMTLSQGPTHARPLSGLTAPIVRLDTMASETYAAAFHRHWKGSGMATRQMTPEAIMQLGIGFWGSKTLLSAIELGLFTELSERPLDAKALTQRLNLHPRSARDFFDALVALGMLRRTGTRYANTPDTALFLDRSKPSYVGGMLEMANARLYRFWGSLTEALRTGKPQNEVKAGEDFFGTLYADPKRLEGFLKAMTGLSVGAARIIAKKFPWRKYRSFIDVGCAQGGVAVEIALAHTHLAGGGMDLPVVQPVFEAYARAKKVERRLRFHPGNFFTDSLPKSDVVIMGHILHDWTLDEKMMLLRKAHDALPPGGAVIVHEAIIDDARRHNAFGLLMSLNMLIETPGGFDFTGADCKRWMKEVGFKRTTVEALAGPDSMVIGIK